MDKLRQLRDHPRIKQLADVRNIGLYIFGLIVLSVSWSGLKVIQRNYNLQKEIATMEQEVAIAELENANLELKNRYYESDQFLELAARRHFSLAAPGEKMLIVPKQIALSKTKDLRDETPAEPADPDLGKAQYQKNIEAWMDFFLNRHDDRS